MHRNGYSGNRTILSIAVVACLGGCATDDGLVIDPAWNAGRAGAGAVNGKTVGIPARTTREPAEPFQLEFPALITQSVRWASVDVRIAKVQQIRGSSEVVDALYEARLDPNRIYVRLELAIANKDRDEVDYRNRST